MFQTSLSVKLDTKTQFEVFRFRSILTISPSIRHCEPHTTQDIHKVCNMYSHMHSAHGTVQPRGRGSCTSVQASITCGLTLIECPDKLLPTGAYQLCSWYMHTLVDPVLSVSVEMYTCTFHVFCSHIQGRSGQIRMREPWPVKPRL